MSLLHTLLLPPFPSSFENTAVWKCGTIVVVLLLFLVIWYKHYLIMEGTYCTYCTFRTCVLCCILSHSYTLVFWDFFSETCCIVSVISIYIIYYCSILQRFEHKRTHFSCKKALYCTINKKYVLNSKWFPKNCEWFWLSMMCVHSA